MPPLLKVSALTKHYGPVIALDSVDFDGLASRLRQTVYVQNFLAHQRPLMPPNAKPSTLRACLYVPMCRPMKLNTWLNARTSMNSATWMWTSASLSSASSSAPSASAQATEEAVLVAVAEAGSAGAHVEAPG